MFRVAQVQYSSVELLAKLRDDIRAVVLDMTMPVMSGQDALRKLREIRLDLPVIASSGYSELEARRQFGDGLSGLLQKPYTAALLNNIVGQVLEAKVKLAPAARVSLASYL